MRSRRAVLLAEIPVLVAVAVLAVVLRPASTPAGPERVTARVSTCDLQSTGAASITYTVVNGDRTEHAYKVELVVAAKGSPLGSGVGLVNRVHPGATVTGRALVPVRGDTTGAACTVRATAHDGHAGHGS